MILFEIIGESWDFDQVMSFSIDEYFKYGQIICIRDDEHMLSVSIGVMVISLCYVLYVSVIWLFVLLMHFVRL